MPIQYSYYLDPLCLWEMVHYDPVAKAGLIVQVMDPDAKLLFVAPCITSQKFRETLKSSSPSGITSCPLSNSRFIGGSRSISNFVIEVSLLHNSSSRL